MQSGILSVKPVAQDPNLCTTKGKKRCHWTLGAVREEQTSPVELGADLNDSIGFFKFQENEYPCLWWNSMIIVHINK